MKNQHRSLSSKVGFGWILKQAACVGTVVNQSIETNHMSHDPALVWERKWISFHSSRPKWTDNGITTRVFAFFHQSASQMTLPTDRWLFAGCFVGACLHARKYFSFWRMGKAGKSNKLLSDSRFIQTFGMSCVEWNEQAFTELNKVSSD